MQMGFVSIGMFFLIFFFFIFMVNCLEERMHLGYKVSVPNTANIIFSRLCIPSAIAERGTAFHMVDSPRHTPHAPLEIYTN